MKANRYILVGLVAAFSVAAVGAWAQTRSGVAFAPRLNPFEPDAALTGGTWTGEVVTTEFRITPAAAPFTPPRAVRPPFFPPPRSPYFPGPR